ncbi:biotin--[acetyl-CoA-carboxylase] ligase [Microbacterium sp. SCN 71-17]|uniref:biotin--[acetyl-CoA-carboxylase] ligase n=1 Tax=Microbacterium sp. SCN 71-17 TaxID=1660111 RepID=UPI000A58C508|nr:biotin--[acetyl-CoA-carboxylase] ligase [Microbacterium sp. SCN 71-17]
MPIPAAGYPLTAALSPRVQVVETTDSTNADVVAAVTADPAGWPHLSLLVTDDQRAGRGRLDRTWTAPAGTALAVSVVVDAGRIPMEMRGWIPLAAGAAMTRAIDARLVGHGPSAQLKWPNDVLVDGGKICGILAEAVPGSLDTVVIGSGINTRMTRADLPVSTATSFAAMGVEVFHDFDAALEGAEVVMMLRLQQERMAGQFIPSAREYHHLYGLTKKRLARAVPEALVMHPGPMNRGVEIDSEVADLIDRSIITQQVEMGVAIRMACLDILTRTARGVEGWA